MLNTAGWSRPRSRRRVLGVAAGLGLVVVAATTSVAAPQGPVGATATNISKDPGYADGEPQVAVNPTNSANVIFDWSGISSTTGDYTCGLAYSMDAGSTWKTQRIAGCLDAIAAFDAKGVAYVGGIQRNSGGATVFVIRSRDGGRTWSDPVEAIGINTDAPNAQRGAVGPFDAYDRPWVAVDASTGTVYVSAVAHTQAALNPATVDAKFLGGGQRYVVASHDGGATFGIPYALDSADLPARGMGTISAARGDLAAAYPTAAGSALGGPDCASCIVFETSKNDGKTWDRHVIPNSQYDAEAQDVVGAYVAADPSVQQRYAVGVIEGSGRELRVHVTRDAGRSWQPPAGVEPASEKYIANRPWVAYAADGTLGVMWRRDYHTGDCASQEQQFWFQRCPYDVFAAWSRSGDGHFAPPVRLTASPTKADDSYFLGDDVSYLVVGRGTLYATWGDWRGGELDAWLGSVRFG